MTLNEDEKYLIEHVVPGSGHKITVEEARMLYRVSKRHVMYSAVVLKKIDTVKERTINLLEHIKVCKNPPRCTEI